MCRKLLRTFFTMHIHGDLLLVELFGPLRSAVGRKSVEIRVEGRIRLAELFERLDKEVQRFVFDESGRPQPGVLVLVNGVDVRYLSWLDTEVGDEDVVTLIPSIHGG